MRTDLVEETEGLYGLWKGNAEGALNADAVELSFLFPVQI